MNARHLLWTLLPCAVVLCLAAWLRGAEYDEQYTLFLTSGVPRPDWPATVFAAGLARDIQTGDASLIAIARDLRATDVHPPLYFWLVSAWRALLDHGLFVTRLLSVVLGVAALALTGAIARLARLPPTLAIWLTLGCYAFTYTSVIARGFALAQLLLLGGVACLLPRPRIRHYVLGGCLLGAATMTNYLAVFVACACLFSVMLEALWRTGPDAPKLRQAIAAMFGFLLFIPADLWWFLGQRASRPGQFEPFSLIHGAARLAVRFSGAILGGLPLYAHGPVSTILAAALGSLLLWMFVRVVRRWRFLGLPRARIMLALAVLATPFGLLVLGFVFDNTPIEIRYLTFSIPFVGLLLAGALGPRLAALVLTVQAASIAGLMLAPQTMQPARAAARAAAAMAQDGVVLLPRGNDGVGIVGAFAIESPPALPLLLIAATDTPEQIRARIGGWHRVVLALLEQDDASRAATAAMRLALTAPMWREVAREPTIAVYVRIADRE